MEHGQLGEGGGGPLLGRLILDQREFYEAGYTQPDAAEAERLGRWRALGARSKAAHVRALCAETKLRPRSLVEIGCGDGALLAALRGLAPVFDGFELSAPAAALARRALPDARRVEAFDGSEVPAEDGSYDLAILSHVLEHVPVPGPLLAEAARVAHEVVVEVPLEDNRSARRPEKRAEAAAIGHLHFFSRAEVHGLVDRGRPESARPSSATRCRTRTTPSSRTARPPAPPRSASGACGPGCTVWPRGPPRRCSPCTTRCWPAGRRRRGRPRARRGRTRSALRRRPWRARARRRPGSGSGRAGARRGRRRPPRGSGRRLRWRCARRRGTARRRSRRRKGQEVDRVGDHPLREAPERQELDHPVRDAERALAERDGAHARPCEVAVGEQGRVHLPYELLDLLLPALGVRLGEVHLAGEALDQQRQQLVLAGDVGVERGGPGAQSLGDAAHADGVEPARVEDPQRGVDDPVAVERPAGRLGSRRAAAAPGRLGSALDTNTILRMRNSVRAMTNGVRRSGGTYASCSDDAAARSSASAPGGPVSCIPFGSTHAGSPTRSCGAV